jgi:hypothetical protein
MKLIIDSEPADFVAINSGTHTFTTFCQNVMERLLDKNRSIASCKLDGQLINSIDDADREFPNSTICEIESVPISLALKSALALQCSQCRRLESACDKLVTECLLSDPKEIIDQWQSMCEMLKDQMRFLPQLSYLLTDHQVEQLAERNVQELNAIMNHISTSFQTADVVAVSDILELELLPWLRQFREILMSALKMSESMNPET